MHSTFCAAVDYEETWAEQMMAAIDEEDEDEDVIDDFS